MGGIWSGRYGRRSARRSTSECYAIGVRSLRAALPSQEPTPNGCAGGRLRFSTTPQPTGGVRWWVHCPHCDRRCTRLYGAVTLGCRVCLRLTFRSQRLTTRQRYDYGAAKLLARIGCTRDDPFFYRPKGMHWSTFTRIIERVEEYADAADAVALGSFMRAAGRAFPKHFGRA